MPFLPKPMSLRAGEITVSCALETVVTIAAEAPGITFP